MYNIIFQAATVDKLAKVLKECEEFDALKALTPTSLQNTQRNKINTQINTK